MTGGPDDPAQTIAAVTSKPGKTMSDAIGRAGNWRIQLVEVGSGRHPGSWVGPTYPKWYWSPINVVVLRRRLRRQC